MKKRSTTVEPLKFSRPLAGLSFVDACTTELHLSGSPAWRGNGGPTRGHPARSYPFTLEATFERAKPIRLHLVGVFALYAGAEHEVTGNLGASLQLYDGDELVFHQELINGLHYSDTAVLEREVRTLGDGSTINSIGSIEIEGQRHRIDELTLDVPIDLEADRFKFKALSSPASFIIFDAFIETAGPHGCPFHSGGGGVPLARIGAIVRLGDRVEFGNAMIQLEEGILGSSDLDEARGLALTFLAVLTAALLETGSSKRIVLEQLNSARELEHANTNESVWESVSSRIEKLTPALLNGSPAYSDRLMDRALSHIDRHYARPLSDAVIAHQLGLSTSHFRFLFKQATGQPFHKYLIAARLEKAHQMLLDLDAASVGVVAKAVGFVGLSHFSRAFTNRFNVSPASVRKNSPGHA